MQYFQDHQDQYNAPDDQFRRLAYGAPAPSGACCAAANQFVGQKCSCDSTLLGNAGQVQSPAYSKPFLCMKPLIAHHAVPAAPLAYDDVCHKCLALHYGWARSWLSHKHWLGAKLACAHVNDVPCSRTVTGTMCQ